MINLNKIIVSVLREIKGVKNLCKEYPEDFALMPTVTYKENENSDTGKTTKEVISNIEYQFDIWNKGATFDIATQIDESLSGMGFRRVTSVEIVDPSSKLNHRIMRYRGKYDAIHNRICQ